MAELKRNFLKGRMNKDLDERLVSNGEYRDALNIEVSTSEGSEVGTVQNIKGNYKVSSFPATYRSIDGSLSSYTNQENAVSVGSYVNNTTDKAYSFIHKASDFVESGSYGTSTRFEGVRCDYIHEYCPSISEDSGTNKGVLVDLYEARFAASSITTDGVTKHPMQDTAGNSTWTTITGLPTIETNVQGIITTLPLGIRVGMRVQMITPAGTDLWTVANEVVVTKILSSTTSNGRIQITAPINVPIYTAGLRDESGVVFKFTAPRILNFSGGVSAIETNTSNTLPTPTPTNKIITGINIVDDLLFFTDGRNEPKKLNISRCKSGTKNLYTQTKQTVEGVTFNTEEAHITTIKPNPKYPPTTDVISLKKPAGVSISLVNDNLIDQGNSPLVYDGTNGIPEIFYSEESSSLVFGWNGGEPGNLSFLSGLGNVSEIGDTVSIFAQTEKVHWRNGEEITLTGNTSGAVFKCIIDGAYSGNGLTSNFQIFELIVTVPDASYASNTAGETWQATASLDFDFYPEKFISFAYRYKYIDGEVSCISPYSVPTFTPGVYAYSSREGQNSGMINNASAFIVKDFITKDIPKDVTEVELLFRDHDYDSVHHFRTIKSTDSSWNTSGTGSNYGNIEINTELFGEMLPQLQQDRLWDNVPRAALSQEFSAGRLMFGNYLQNYDIPIANILDFKTVTPKPTDTQLIELGNTFSATASDAVFNIGDDVSSVGSVQAPHSPTGYYETKSFIATSELLSGSGLAYYRFVNDISYNWDGAKNLDRYVSASYWPIGTSDQNTVPQIRSSNYVKEGFAGLNQLEQLDISAGSSWNSGEDQHPLVSKYLQPAYHGRWKFRVNFDNETYDGGNNYASNASISPTNPIQTSGWLDNTGATAPPTSVYKLTETGEYQVLAHGRYRCARGSDVNEDTSVWEEFQAVDGVFNIYRCTENGEPYGLPLLLGNTGTAGNYTEAGGTQFTVFGTQKTNAGEPAGSGYEQTYRGTKVEGTFMVTDTETYDHEKAVVGQYICVCFEIEPLDFLWDNEGMDEAVAGLVNNKTVVITTIDSKASGNGVGDYVRDTPDSFGNTGNAVFKVTSAPTAVESVSISQGVKSVKSNRSYQLGWVFGDKFGRESSIITDEAISIKVPHYRSSNLTAFQARILSNAPTWAEYYKFFVRETTSRFYNIALHKAYDNEDPGDEILFAWLSFNSADRDKVQIGDKLLLKKIHGFNTPVGSEFKLAVLDISNEVPNSGTSGTGADEDEIGDDISGGDRTGKFFVKVKHSNTFFNQLGSFGDTGLQDDTKVSNGAIFEVLPKSLVVQSEDSDEKFGFFFEASQAYPIKLTKDKAEQYVPVGSTVELYWASTNISDQQEIWNSTVRRVVSVDGASTFGVNQTTVSNEWNDAFCKVTLDSGGSGLYTVGGSVTVYIKFTRPDGSYTVLKLAKDANTLDSAIYLYPTTMGMHIGLPWFNCYSFLNGVESDGIEDRFNSPTLFPYTAIGKQSGFKGLLRGAETEEEWRYNDIIFSQLYNEDRGIDGSNQFILADTPIKKLSPAHGSIQKLFARDSDLIALCENKILRILSSGKDALFNADGNMQLLASERVLGQAIPFSGDYGISKNPESFASDEFRCYFTDRDRGSILRLSRDGLTPINLAGMKDWFGDNLRFADVAIGSFDGKKDEYNLTIHSVTNPGYKKDVYTLSFSEGIDGWVSFKSFIQESGFSLNNKYYTIKGGQIYLHHPETTVNRNLFYSDSATAAEGTHGIQESSTVTPILNDMPDVVKSFKTLNYEGSQSRIVQAVADIDGDGDTEAFGGGYYNLTTKNGWYVEDIHTDLQEGQIDEFIEKEGKWFNYIHGVGSAFTNAADAGAVSTNIDFNEFSTQGIGVIASQSISGSTSEAYNVTVYLGGDTTTSFEGYSVEALNIYNISTLSGTSQMTIIPNPNVLLSAASFATITGSATDLFSSVTFANSGTANTPSNTIVATINWVSGSVSSDTVINLGVSVVIEELVYVQFQVAPFNAGNFGSNFLGNLGFTGVLDGLYVSSIISTFGSNIGETVGYNVAGVVPANTLNELLTVQVSGDGFNTYVSSITVLDNNAEEIENFSSVVSTNGSNTPTSVTISHNTGGTFNFTSLPAILLSTSFTQSSLNFFSDYYEMAEEGETYATQLSMDDCEASYVTITPGENYGDGSWITASVISNSAVSVVTTQNTSSLTRTAEVNVFSNLNTSTTPNDTLYISQQVDEYVNLKAAFQTVDGTNINIGGGGNWWNGGAENIIEIGGTYGDNYPMTINNETIGLPVIPASGIEDLRLTISSNDTFVNINQDSYLEVVYDGESGWISIDNLISMGATNTNAYSPFVVNCDIQSNSSTTSRTATIKAIHPTNNIEQDAITITQEAGYNSATDTAEFYYNASQDYTNYTVGSIPDEGTLVS